MDIKELQENISNYLNNEVSIKSPLLIDVDRNVFLSDIMLSNEFRVDIDSESFIDQLEEEMTCTVGTPNIKYCDDAFINGKLVNIDGRYHLREIKEFTLIFSPEETLKVI